jgi:hypothetical protein
VHFRRRYEPNHHPVAAAFLPLPLELQPKLPLVLPLLRPGSLPALRRPA